MSYRSIRALGVACALALFATPALATSVQYDFQSGSAQLDVGVSGIGTVLSASAPLTGTFTTFDDTVPALTDLEWVIQDSVDLGILLGTLDITVTVTDAVGFTSTASSTGAGTYDWSGGQFDVVADISLTGGLLGDLGPIQILATIDAADGTVTIAGNTGTFTANRREMFTFSHAGYDVTVEATLNFVGTVPEPGIALLLLTAGLAVAARRH